MELKKGITFSKPLVAVTFDDGYGDNFELAAPLLEEQNLRATFFVTSGFVGQGEVQWFDRAADSWLRISHADRIGLVEQLPGISGKKIDVKQFGIQAWMSYLKGSESAKRAELVQKAESMAGGSINSEGYRPMTPEQLAELHLRGHEIASHTVSHPILPQVSDQELRNELVDSAEQLRKWTGGDIPGFCYPNGDFDSRVERAVIDAGYSYACIIGTGMNRQGASPTRLVRRPITMQRTLRSGQHDLLGFRAELCGFREWWR